MVFRILLSDFFVFLYFALGFYLNQDIGIG